MLGRTSSMELDVEIEDPAAATSGTGRMSVDMDGDARFSGKGGWRPVGPHDLDSVLRWAPQFIDMVGSHGLGSRLLGNLCSRFMDGIVMSTMYSGIGGPEIAFHTLMNAFDASRGITGQLTMYSAADISKEARRVLRYKHSVCGPLHVFGDLLHRVPAVVLEQLLTTHSQAEEEFKNTGEEDTKAASSRIGQAMMAKMIKIMQSIGPSLPPFGHCYKCNSRCRFFPIKDEGHAGIFYLVVAGSTCTSWSRMGKRQQWGAMSAIVFTAWAFSTLQHQPDAIIHECTEDFDTSMLELIFAALYVVASFVFCPVDLGIPSSRPRKYTMLLHRRRCFPSLQYGPTDFAEMFFRRCMCDGHVYWSAAAGWVQAELARLATLLHLPPCQADDSAWAFRDVISAALLGRLLGYEKLCRKVRRRAAFIVNLLQNAHWTNSLSDKVPSLLAGSSALWSMVAERLLLPIERLSVQGIGVFDHRLWHERYSIE